MREFSLPALYEVPSGADLTDSIHRNAERHPDVAVVSGKIDGRWQDFTATEFLAQVRAAAKGLVAAGVEAGDRVALMSRTRYEWTLLDFAVWCAGGITVPVYETSSAEQVEWILGDSGAVACITELPRHDAVVGEIRERLPALRELWQIESGAVAELTRLGAEVPDAVIEERRATLGPDTIATIVYTSGTTGRPKGCQLTHANFLAELGNVTARLTPLFRTGESSVLLFLPEAHVLGRIAEIAAAMAPVRLGHLPDIKDVVAELATFRPTLILGVPRVFEKVYNSARAKAQSEARAGSSTAPPTSPSPTAGPWTTAAPRWRSRSSTSSTTPWSTASCGPPSAAGPPTRSPAARPWASGSATSSAASASPCWRATA